MYSSQLRMPHCVLFPVLLLVGACFFTWAAPLSGTSSPQERRCERSEQPSRDTSEHPASHYDDKMCIISSPHLASSPLVQEPRGTADVLSSAKPEEMTIAVPDAILGHIRQIELFRRSAKTYTQFHEESTEPTDESSVEERSQKLLPGSPYESFPLVDHTMAPGSENTEEELSTSPENYAEQKVGPSILPIQPRTDKPAQTQVTLGHSDLRYSDIKEDKGTGQPLIKPRPLKQEGGRAVKTIKNQFDELKSSARVSTEPPFSAHTSVSLRNINPAVTAQTTSGNYNGQTGGSPQDKERAAEVNLDSAAEQDKALVPGLLQPDLTLSSRLAELGDTWTEPVHLQGVEEASVLPLLQEVGTEATMSSEDLPLIFEPFDDVTPSSSSALASELSVAMAPATGMLGETELEQTYSMDTDHSPQQGFPGPSDWPSPWQMSGAENSDTVSSSQMPITGAFSEANMGRNEKAERIQNTDVLPTSVDVPRLPPSPVSVTTQKVADIKTTHSAVLKPVSGLEELESQENEDEEDEYADESDEEEEESEEELTEVPVHSPTRTPYILIPPPPVWGQRNQGLIRSWVKLIREKAGYVSGMLAPVGIGIAGALLIVGALYGIRVIHRKRKNSLKHQRRKQPTEVRSGPDQAMLLADSSEDEF